MRQGRRHGLSTEQKADIWRRWKAGESLHEIGRAFDKDHGSIQFLLSKHGGIAPPARRRSPRTLTLAEREEISRGIASGSSLREIARGLERATSTVSREVIRHGGRQLYRASEADDQAWKSALRPKTCLLANQRRLRLLVASKLILNWSPEQISGWLKRRYPCNESNARVPRDHLSQLIHPGSRSAEERAGAAPSVQAADPPLGAREGWREVSWSDRRCYFDQRKTCRDRGPCHPRSLGGGPAQRVGHSHIATLVERHSRFTILVKVPSKETATVVDALTRQVRKLPASLRRSLMWDRGLEMAKHKTFTVATKVDVYFCDPQSPWQRGTNENTNGLLRQYFSRKSDLSGYSQAELDKVAMRLNQRPRKTLGFETPASRLHASVASTS